MNSIPRHQCMIYYDPPSRHLGPISLTIQKKLMEHFRCVYLNSEPMIAGLRSYLAAAGVDVESELKTSNLILSSERPHLVDGRFEIEVMLNGLQRELERALRDGYTGLWATGDMTWELGSDHDIGKLLEYEQGLEELFQSHPQLAGVCQYHVNSLPRLLVDGAARTHSAIFVNETLSILNANFARRESLSGSTV
jgi:hypothetical protein